MLSRIPPCSRGYHPGKLPLIWGPATAKNVEIWQFRYKNCNLGLRKSLYPCTLVSTTKKSFDFRREAMRFRTRVLAAIGATAILFSAATIFAGGKSAPAVTEHPAFDQHA